MLSLGMAVALGGVARAGYASIADWVNNTLNPDLFVTASEFELAGPRENLFFDPAMTRAGIVTCGGLCPGLNNVIRSVFLQLHHNYGVTNVMGIRYGYSGLNAAHRTPPVRLTTEFVESIHKLGGTVLGSSRGPEDPGVMVDFLEDHKVSMLFAVGGDGTQRGAHAIAEEIQRFRNLYVQVPSRSHHALAEHRQVMLAVIEGDEEKAARLMYEHIGFALAHIQSPDYEGLALA